jgi:RNA polymerase sigma factor (sigma-70 family)
MDLETRRSLLDRLRDPADSCAWEVFHHTYRTLILGYCTSRGLQISDAEDVLQLVLIALARGASSFRYDPARGRFRSYLRSAVVHAIAELRASRRRMGSSGHDPALFAALTTEDDGVDLEWERQWKLHHYERALRSLQRTLEPLSVRVFESLLRGNSTAAAALEFGLSVDAVHKIKQRVRDRLQSQIAAQVADEESSRGPRGT